MSQQTEIVIVLDIGQESSVRPSDSQPIQHITRNNLCIFFIVFVTVVWYFTLIFLFSV